MHNSLPNTGIPKKSDILKKPDILKKRVRQNFMNSPELKGN